MGFRIQINGEDIHETQEEHVAVEYVSVTTPRGEVARVGLAPEENVINLVVHTRSRFDGFSPLTTDVAYRNEREKEVEASTELVEAGRRQQEEEDRKAEEEREFQASLADMSPEEQAQAFAERNAPEGPGQQRGGFGPAVSGVASSEEAENTGVVGASNATGGEPRAPEDQPEVDNLENLNA